MASFSWRRAAPRDERVSARATHPTNFRLEERPPPDESVLAILVVCTANVSRSPLAAAVLQLELDLGSVDAAVTSGGTAAAPSLRTDPRSVRHAESLGIVLPEIRPRQATGELLATRGRDLVLTMTREQVREIGAISPQVIHRTFTLKTFARTTPPCEPRCFQSAVEAMAAARCAADLFGHDPHDDVVDPNGRSDGHFDMVADELVRAVHQAADFISRCDHRTRRVRAEVRPTDATP